MHGLQTMRRIQEYHAAVENGGDTITPDGHDPKGYGVGFLPDAQVLKVHKNWFSFQTYSAVRNTLWEKYPDVNIGFWLDTKTQIWYCEPSRMFADKTEAIAFAKEHKQIAIWDYAKKEEIRL